MNWKTSLIIAATMLGLLSAGACLAGPGIGQPAPGFTLPDSAGVNRSLSNYAGMVRMINFWAAW